MSSTSDIAAKRQALKNAGLDLGAATGPEQDVGFGGRMQAYQNGRIYWHAQIGVHEVHGGILTKYLEIGGPGNHPKTGRRELGFPKSDEKTTPDGLSRVSEFEWGAIYWVRGAGAVPLYGPLYKSWAGFGFFASVSAVGTPLTEPFKVGTTSQAAIFNNGFLFTFGADGPVFTARYQGPRPGKPEVVTPDRLDIAGFVVSMPQSAWKTMQLRQPNFLTDLLKDRLVLQRVDNPASQIPLVADLVDGGSGGSSGGVNVLLESLPTDAIFTASEGTTTVAPPAPPVVRDHRGESSGPIRPRPTIPISTEGAVIRDHRDDTPPTPPPTDPTNPNVNVTLHLRLKLAPGAQMKDRSLYNVSVKMPNGSAVPIGLHAVYAKQDWTNFGFIHSTDIHVSGRADGLFGGLRKVGREESAAAFANPNDAFRDLIRYANRLHAKGLIDAILATGDLVDYQYDDKNSGDTQLGGNFLLFELLLAGASPSPKGTPVEPLRVPIFTTLGNHDYRKIPYGLFFDISVPVVSDPTIENFANMNLTEDDIRALQGGKPDVSSDDALAQVRVNKPAHYFQRINTVQTDLGSSYLLRLGPHRIAVLDSKHDIGIIEGSWDAFKVSQFGIGGEDKISFADGTPNQVGVSETHLTIVRQALSEAGNNGVVIAGIHGPPINIKGAEFAIYFRETEHVAVDKRDVMGYLLRQSLMGPALLNNAIRVGGGGKITSINWSIVERMARKSHPGWMDSIGQSHFMSGTVDDLLDRDVSKGKMDDFLQLCAGATPGTPRPVDLVLCGHGHNRVEYRVKWDAGQKKMLYFMDYYTENPPQYYGCRKASFDFGNEPLYVTVKAGAPVNGTPNQNIRDHRWEGEETTVATPPYPDPLNSARDKAAWWAARRPLIMETAATGPIESSSNDRPAPKKRKPGPRFQGFRVVSIAGKNISSIRYITIDEMRAGNFSLPWEGNGRFDLPGGVLETATSAAAATTVERTR